MMLAPTTVALTEMLQPSRTLRGGGIKCASPNFDNTLHKDRSYLPVGRISHSGMFSNYLQLCMRWWILVGQSVGRFDHLERGLYCLAFVLETCIKSLPDISPQKSELEWCSGKCENPCSSHGRPRDP